MKQLFLGLLCIAFFADSQAQCNNLIVENNTGHTIWFEFEGNTTCNVGTPSGVFNVVSGTPRFFDNITYLPPNSDFTMVIVYDGDDTWTSNPCNAGSPYAWVSGCSYLNSQGINDTENLTYMYPTSGGGPCAIGQTATVTWYNNSPNLGTCRVVIQ